MSEVQPASPSSDVPYIAHSPRTSIDGAPNPQSPTHLVHPPTAFKFMAAFKRSRSNLSPEPGLPSSAPQLTDRDEPGKRKAAIPHVKQMHERPLSFASASTDPNTSSLRSAATAAESFSSQRKSHLSNGTQGSAVSAVGKSEEPKSSKITSTSRASASIADQDEARPNIPGSLPQPIPGDIENGNQNHPIVSCNNLSLSASSER
ncbi:hypothetical protein BD779DRAFT_1670591 [Infundibulicybe gibba]|nr:hypothetical protein BD779DRAFT_1670591 [Infundibulicybe gibba]